MNLKKIILGTFSWKRIITSLLIIYVIMTVFVHYISDSLMFPYNQSSYNSKLPGLSFIKSKDGTKIATRFWKASNETNLILYFHGNYLDIGHLGEMAIKLNVYGYSVLAMDYRGYGLSQGIVSENNAYLDSQRLYDYAIEMGYVNNQIIILGRSIGSGIATDLAMKNKSRALILISPFVSAYRIISNIPIFPFDKFNNLAKISKVKQPLFIIHGAEDEIIKPWHSQMLFNEHKGLKQRHLINGVGHNGILDSDLDEIFNQFESLVKDS